MDRFSSLQAFVRVVESGSFVRAAERLAISTSSLSRQIAELEEHLGARLLQRTTRKLSLTEGGQAFYERCVQVLNDLAEAEAAAGQTAAVPRGTIRLTCSHHIGQHRIAPAIAGFVAKYPEVRFDVSVADRFIDLIEEGFDLALRIGAKVGSEQLVARRLGSTRIVPCAAPRYLRRHGTPKKPEDLARHNALTYAYASAPRVWRLVDAAGQTSEVRVSGSLHANSGDTLVAAAIAGLGIVFEPDFIVRDALADGRLVPVLTDYTAPHADIWAVYPSRRHLSLKVRLFVDHIATLFQESAPAAPAARAAARRAGKKPQRKGR
jgi:DNA-binding transcriptional LysR family regulator